MKKTKSFLVALALSICSFAVFGAQHTSAATKTWTGGGSDTNMNTAGNWSGGAPSAGDDLIFPANISNRTIVNNYTAATSFNSITFSGAATGGSGYSISGNSITLVAGITHSMTGDPNDLYQNLTLPIILDGTQSFAATGDGKLGLGGTLNLGSSALTTNVTTGAMEITGVVSGTGTITKTGAGAVYVSGANTYSGATTVSAGTFQAVDETALGTTAGATTVAAGAKLSLLSGGDGDKTYAENITFGGGSTTALLVGFATQASGTEPFGTSTLSGAITLQANIKVVSTDRKAKVTGAITGNFTITLDNSSTGTFELASSSNGSATANGVLEVPASTTTYADNLPSTSITVATNETATVTGTYGSTVVNPSGTLKGTGTVGSLTVRGILAPGMSPGCLNSGDLAFFAGATYQFEVGGTTACSGYDQTVVTGTVTLDGNLSVVLYNNFKPTAGQKYVIISNNGSDAITGTFSGLAQGATITVGSYQFSISYTGGDGNDVELTVTAGAPATGFSLSKSNPLVTLAVTLGAAGAIALMARRTLQTAATRRKR
jgi:fibronectin-binding autotransporter adhesin